jgi:hypothetical protein
MTAAYKKATMEHILPSVLTLRHLLGRLRHPALVELFVYIRVMMSDFKDELQEVWCLTGELSILVTDNMLSGVFGAQYPYSVL